MLNVREPLQASLYMSWSLNAARVWRYPVVIASRGGQRPTAVGNKTVRLDQDVCTTVENNLARH